MGRNNKRAAPITRMEEDGFLKKAKELLEYQEIAENIERRLKVYDRYRNIPWQNIKKKHGL